MAKGQHLSRYQQGIVRRYYEHMDTLSAQKLGELVSELYLCDDPKKAEKMWQRAEQALAKAGVEEKRYGAVVRGRNVEQLARLVSELAPGGKRS